MGVDFHKFLNKFGELGKQGRVLELKEEELTDYLVKHPEIAFEIILSEKEAGKLFLVSIDGAPFLFILDSSGEKVLPLFEMIKFKRIKL